MENVCMSPELLVESTKLVGFSKSSDASLLTYSVKTHFKEQVKDTIDVFVHDPDTMTNKQITRNDIGVKSLQPEILSNFLKGGAVADQVTFIRNGKLCGTLLSGGESYIVSDQPISIDSYHIFKRRDDRMFAILQMEVYAGKTPAETASIDAQPAGTSGVLYDKLMIRHWDQWNPYGKRNHLFLCALTVDADGLIHTDNASMIDLMFELETDCPGKNPGLGNEEYSVSADGNYLSMACRSTQPGKSAQKMDVAWTTDVPIVLVDLTAAMNRSNSCPAAVPLQKISSDEHKGYNSAPVFSPDSRKVAWLSMPREKYEADRNVIKVYDIESGVMKTLTEDIDLSFASIEFECPPSDASVSSPVIFTDYTIYVNAQHRGIYQTFRLKMTAECALTSLEIANGDDSRVQPIFVPVHSAAKRADTMFFGGKATGYVYFLESSLTHPFELKRIVTCSDSGSSVFSPFNPAAMQHNARISMSRPSGPCFQEIYCASPQFSNGDVVMPEVHNHYFTGANGDAVQCWYLPPVLNGSSEVPATQPAGSVPLLVVIHGGPQVAFMNLWNARWNIGTMAARGFGVLAVNYHGSSGFGQKFTDSIRKDWGGAPYEDIMTGLDYILKEHAYLDTHNVAALGGSYGGYMVNWINGHTDRFKCLVCHAGIFSLRNQYFNTEELFFPEWEFGTPWENPQEYLKQSPDSFVQNWKTPCLVIHGGKDFRVCETEGISCFTALQRKGIDSKFLYFPDENHWILKPLNSLKWYNTVFSWLDSYLRPTGADVVVKK